MQRTHRSDTLLIALAASLLAFFLAGRVFNDGAPGWKHIVTSDGRGYYAYLPALFIDGDLTFRPVVEREGKLLGYPHYRPGYLVNSGDRTVNKYFAGEALLLLPFFLAGAAATAIAGTPMDGYSFFFQLFTGLGALFYTIAGLWFLRRLLRREGVPDAVSAVILVALLAGTNLLYYALWQPTMSHLYSFCAVNGFMWFTAETLRQPTRGRFALAATFFAVVCLIRPVNGVVLLLIPFLAKEPKTIARSFTAVLRDRLTLIAGLIPAAAILFIQPLLWRLQTGHWIVWSYAGEGFRFGSPEVYEVLFGFRKGLLPYAPLLALFLTGLVPLFIRSRTRFFSLLLFFAAAIYVTASWWNWYYGDGLGLRAFIDYYGVFALTAGFLPLAFPRLNRKVASILLALLAAPFILFNLVLTWQYTHGLIHPNSMNAGKYRYIFMKTDPELRGVLGGNEELPDYEVDMNKPLRTFYHDIEKPAKGWYDNCIVAEAAMKPGNHAGCVDSLHPYSAGIAVQALEAGPVPGSWFIRGSVRVRDSVPGASDRAFLVLSMDSVSSGENWWQGFRLNDFPQENARAWNLRTFSLMTPIIGNPRGILKVYIWNTGKEPLLIDDFRIEIFGKNNQGKRL